MEEVFAIKKENYLNAEAVTKKLDELRDSPVYSIKPEALAEYEAEYFNKKCLKSKEMVDMAGAIIPGAVQHNLAFNYPFPIAFDKAEGAFLYDIDGNKYFDFLQAGGPIVLVSNPPKVR